MKGIKEMMKTSELEDARRGGEYRGKLNDKWTRVKIQTKEE